MRFADGIATVTKRTQDFERFLNEIKRILHPYLWDAYQQEKAKVVGVLSLCLSRHLKRTPYTP